MKLAELSKICLAIKDAVGEPLDSKVAKGSDLFITPANKDQMGNLLALTSLACRNATCSLPKSFTGSKGIIRNVPTTFTDEELHVELADQGVMEVRWFMRNIEAGTIPTEIVRLSFIIKRPTRVYAGPLSFPVSEFIPSPYRCKKCWRLGHT